MPLMILLAGPTASGKTELALTLAQRYNCEILSCDASLFYRGMDIGTAKPSPLERAKVPHWGIDITEPNSYFSIKTFIQYAQQCVEDITSRNKNVLVVGGSGFYLKSFLSPMVDDLAPDFSIRQQIADLEQQQGIESCLKRLQALNPNLPSSLDTKNPRLIKKVLERCLSSGLPLEELASQFKAQPIPYAHFQKLTLCIQKPLEVLKWRIRARTHAMLQMGLVDEVQRLNEAHKLLPGYPATSAIGYRETLAFLKHPSSMQELEQEIVHNTYALVKKQLTWLRHQIPIDRWIL